VNGVELDPLHAAKDTSRPLIHKLLAVPALRERYLGYVRDIADKWLDWQKLGPMATDLHALIAADVEKDTRKLESAEAFRASVQGGEASGAPAEGGRGFGPGPALDLKSFAEQRRAYLLKPRESK